MNVEVDMRKVSLLQNRFIALLAALCVLPAVSSAVESPNFLVTVDELVMVDTVTSAELGGARAHLNFPFLKQHHNGKLVATYSVGQTQSGAQSGRQAVSTDGGLTWSPSAFSNGDAIGAHLIVPPGQLSQGFSVFRQDAAGFTSWSNNGRYRSFDGGTTWDGGTDPVTYDTGGVPYVVMNHNYDDIIQSGGILYQTLFGQRLGASTFESVLMVSTNGGKTWNQRSTIAEYTSSQNFGAMGSEGPTETGLLKLDNGDLLAVYRTGQPFPNTDINATSPSLFWSISEDDGFTWSAPKTLGVAGVFPQLRKLPDGSVALTYGRYGAKLMLADPTGKRWSEPVVIHDGPTSGHVELRTNSDGSHVFLYDESGFYPPSWNGSVPSGFVFDNDQSANLWAARLNIQQLPTVQDWGWALNYHGDVTPDSLPVPWTLTQAGTTSAQLWAELGQDFLRTNSTGLSGTRNLTYSLPASAGESQWQEIDFADGMILEFRARVSSATGNNEAKISLGDGHNGSLTLKLSGNGIAMEGLGESSFTNAIAPSFSPQIFHDYRLIIREDVGSGGNLVALLYLDDDLLNPILSQQLSPTISHEIRFGVNPTALFSTARMDVDYLRFASLPTEAIWVANASGEWNHDNQWLAGVSPNDVGQSVLFGGAISRPQTVIADTDVTATQIRFNNLNRYTVAGWGEINLEAVNGDTSLIVDLGSHEFQSIVQFRSDSVIEIAGGASLAMNNSLFLNGNTLTKSGSGSLELNNMVVSSGGIIDVQEGIVTGGGLLVGTLANYSGIVAPGNSPGLLEIVGNYLQGDLATLQIEIAGYQAGIDYDVLKVGGTAALAGLLEISLLNGFEPALGDSFQILTAGEISGHFAAFGLPALQQGLAWDVGQLNSTGSVFIVQAIPEPASGLLLICGILALAASPARRIYTKRVSDKLDHN